MYVGNSCYINSIVQMLYHCATTRNLIYQLEAGNDQPIYVLQNIINKIARREKQIETSILANLIGFEAENQQDANEFFMSLLDNMILDAEKISDKAIARKIGQTLQWKGISTINCTKHKQFIQYNMIIFLIGSVKKENKDASFAKHQTHNAFA